MNAVGHRELLGCATPDTWLDAACVHFDTLLVDHANNEKKAAGTALSLLYRYTGHRELLERLSRLAREELRHFEEVLALMTQHEVEYRHLAPGRYAGALRAQVRAREPARLVDTLLVGALVEARSCERFARLGEVVSGAAGALYRRLLASEARHANDYLELALRYDDGSVEERLGALRDVEAELIRSPDPLFRFHSGVPTPPFTP